MNKPVEENGRGAVGLLELPVPLEEAELASPLDEFEAVLTLYDPLI